MNALQELRQKLAAKIEDLRTFLAKDDTDLTAEEKTTFDATVDQHEADIAALKRQVRAAELEEEADALAQIQVEPGQTGAERREASEDHGWENFGAFAAALVHAGQPGHAQVDERLIPLRADAPGSTTVTGASGAEGGFLVPAAFSARVREYMFDENAMLPKTANDPIEGNTMSFPVDETTPWGTSGVLAYWEGEGQLLTKSAISTEQRTLRLKKLTALVPVTNEMISDSALLNSRLPRLVGRAIGWKQNDAIINGSGAGIPLGIANTLNTALITQTKETSQTADTIVAANVTKMYARNTNPASAEWVINPDAFNQLPLMTIGDQPVWVPPSQGMQGAPTGMLLGRPINLSDTQQTLGDAGDLSFIDFMAYDAITKAGGISLASSIHLWFDYDMTAFRAIFRMDGRPAFRQAITPPNSSVTRSPYVRLGARA